MNESLPAVEAEVKKHTTEQIIRKLREGETLEAQGKGIAAVCQRLEISSQTYHRWKKRFRVMS